MEKKVKRMSRDEPISADRIVGKLTKAKLKLEHVLNPKR